MNPIENLKDLIIYQSQNNDNVSVEVLYDNEDLNDELLKNGPKFGKDYFKELLERIRSIRTNERRIWQQIIDTASRLREIRRNNFMEHVFISKYQR